MNVIVSIEGREAIPVRAIPLLTDWEVLSPDVCANAFAGDEDSAQHFEGLATFRLNGDGECTSIAPREWENWTVRELTVCSERITAEQLSHDTGYHQWRRESIAILPAGVFVWRDAFEAAYQLEYGPKSSLAEASKQSYQADAYNLNFNPEHGPREDWRELVMQGFEQLAASASTANASAPVVANNTTAIPPTPDSAAPTNVPLDPARRLALLRALGGSTKYSHGEWKFTGIGLLVKSEKKNGERRSDEKTIRADLKEAAHAERDTKRAGMYSGLGKR